ncbi:hypothetical protein NitYY0826_C1767 [Nitratiruptor sp. YY08-26]|uniref:DUF262 domain-containing protein n=1 Tax=unclassified Nitratiruptor TaxID=2624044 RepID=UPI001915EE94|nr:MULTISPECIES: DUF262 domain-containing protein [unclassified Nitratiruptor]BCD62881.1 hypothetical protein NitYY0813_C1765 [Nitratiruptor sp. YY08-13]BCD66817.1 hypothetical protein NitYY0826_C1767 [Nitratiruptor sp. YY08-26]
METKKFLDVLKNGIEIPKIQRDYAQGRKREEKKLRRFLEYIKNNLSNKVFLDFVYGVKSDKFIPLDGQQRLTTLFLIYYYVSLENEFLEEFNNFTYDIRNTSKDFLEALVENWDNLKKENIVFQIENSNWFFKSWRNDPTIDAMLNALEVIEEYFKDVSLIDLQDIEFKFFDLKEYKLGDELYIKMNARGKSLNDFQNFKAEFEKNTKPEPKFDSGWLDFFWKKSEKNAEVDFYKFLSYIAEMLYYKENTKNFSFDFYTIVDILIQNKNFLIDILDNLEKIDEAIKFINGNIEMLDIGKIKNFWKEELNNIAQKVIVFEVINYILRYDIDEKLKDFVQVMKNILLSDKKYEKGVIYRQTIGYENIKSYLESFNMINCDNVYSKLTKTKFSFRKDAFNKEIEKAKLILKDNRYKTIIHSLDDFQYFKGNISNVLVENIDLLDKYSKSIRKIFENEDSLIIRAWYSINDFTIELPGLTNWGKRYYFGRKKYWDRILQDEKNKDNLKEFLDTFIKEGSLEKMINYSKYSPQNLRYYFIKYSEFSEKYNKNRFISNDINIFVNKDKFNVEKLNNNNLIGYHINPFIYTIGKKLEEKYNERFAYSAKGDDYSYLKFDNKDYMVLEDNSFKLYNSEHKFKREWKIKNFGDIDIIEEMVELLCKEVLEI